MLRGAREAVTEYISEHCTQQEVSSVGCSGMAPVMRLEYFPREILTKAAGANLL